MAGKASITLLSLAARTATNTIFDNSTSNAPLFDPRRELRTFPTDVEAICYHFILNVTSVTATPSVVFTWDGYTASGAWYNILTSTAVTSTGITVFKIGKDFTGVANLTSHDFLPEKWRLVATHGDADSITYSMDLNMQ